MDELLQEVQAEKEYVLDTFINSLENESSSSE